MEGISTKVFKNSPYQKTDHVKKLDQCIVAAIKGGITGASYAIKFIG